MFNFKSSLWTGFALFLCCGSQLSADSSNLSGHWQVDPAKSKFGDEKTSVLDIQQQGNQITLARTYRDEDGKQVTDHFTCSTDGKACSFADNGHKANVSLWYDSSGLVVLKTKGEKHDSTVEWHLNLDKDGKVMTVTREIMEPSDKTEKLVFEKVESIAAR